MLARVNLYVGKTMLYVGEDLFSILVTVWGFLLVIVCLVCL